MALNSGFLYPPNSEIQKIFEKSRHLTPRVPLKGLTYFNYVIKFLYNKGESMLGNESQAIYDILCDITEISEVYKIVDADEITERLPANFNLTKVQLSQIIRDLKDRDYVDIKYFTPDEYCLRVIKRIEPEEPIQTSEEAVGESAEEAVQSTAKNDKQLEVPGGRSAKPGLVLFMSFLGGVLGSGFVAAITAILLKFVI